MMRKLIAGAMVLAGGLLGGCSTYVADYDYFPKPALVVIPQSLQPPATQSAATQPAMPAEPAAMNVLATVVGVRREDSGNHLPEAVEIRMRLENGAMPAVFDPAQVQLVTGGLVALGPGTMMPAQAVTLSPGQQLEVAGTFPLPAKFSDSTLDLTALRLSVPVTINGRAVQAGMTFQREIPYYAAGPYAGYYPYYPYYGPYFYAYPTFHGGFYEGGGGRRFRR
jgi:hypothetical protein